MNTMRGILRLLGAALTAGVTVSLLVGCGQEANTPADLERQAEETSLVIQEDIGELVQDMYNQYTSRVLGVRCDGVDSKTLLAWNEFPENDKDLVKDLEIDETQETDSQPQQFIAKCVFKVDAWSPLNEADVTNWYRGALCAPEGTDMPEAYKALYNDDKSYPPQSRGIVSCVYFSIRTIPGCGDSFPDCPSWSQLEQELDVEYRERLTQVFPIK